MASLRASSHKEACGLLDNVDKGTWKTIHVLFHPLRSFGYLSVGSSDLLSEYRCGIIDQAIQKLTNYDVARTLHLL